jgi:hypothetical protein
VSVAARLPGAVGADLDPVGVALVPGQQFDEGVPPGLHRPGVACVLVRPARHRRRPELLDVGEQRLGQVEDHLWR